MERGNKENIWGKAIYFEGFFSSVFTFGTDD